MNRHIVSLGTTLLVASLGACAPDTELRGEDVEALSTTRCPSPMPHVGAAGTSLTPAADQRLWFVLHAVGTQNYTCNADGAAWTFTGPSATLYLGRIPVGTHFASAAGPTRPAWRFLDGSTVVMQKVGGVGVDTTAVPWLLLAEVSHEGHGLFDQVSSIQRLNTRGGIAPASPCAAGATARVSYEADYFFYKTSGGNPAHNTQCRSVP